MSNQFYSGIQCLALIARFHQHPAEPSALKRAFQHTDDSLSDIYLIIINLIIVNFIRAAKSLGINATFIQNKVEKISRYLLPAIARHKEVLNASISIIFTDFMVNNRLSTTFPRG